MVIMSIYVYICIIIFLKFLWLMQTDQAAQRSDGWESNIDIHGNKEGM